MCAHEACTRIRTIVKPAYTPIVRLCSRSQRRCTYLVLELVVSFHHAQTAGHRSEVDEYRCLIELRVQYLQHFRCPAQGSALTDCLHDDAISATLEVFAFVQDRCCGALLTKYLTTRDTLG